MNDPFVVQLEVSLKGEKHAHSGFDLRVNLRFPSRGVTVIFGHSGSGKTTLLRCLAGLQSARGVIQVGEEYWLKGTASVPCHKRSIGYVFQESGLLPHLTGEQNLDYGIKRSPIALPQEERANIINLLGITEAITRLPKRMSGGERQRVAIARALMIKPRLLLMDEPLAALDQTRKQEILPYLEKLKAHYCMPMVYVTHSPDEAARLADHIVVMEQGRCVTHGPLQEVLSNLTSPIKLGEDTGVVVTATVVEKRSQWQLIRAHFDGGQLWVRDEGDPIGAQVRIRILARDISLALSAHQDSSIVNILQGQIVEIVPDQHPAMCLTQIQVGSQLFIARTTNYSTHLLNLKPGSQVWLQIKSVAVVR